MMTGRLRSFIVVASLSVLTHGCSGGSSSGGGSFATSLNGNWVGTWKNDELGPGSQNQGIMNEGFIRTELQEDSNGNVSGTATWTGFACFLNATVTGIVSGGAVSLTFSDGPIRVTFNGRRIGDTNMEGGWDNDSGCIGEGDMTLNREP